MKSCNSVFFQIKSLDHIIFRNLHNNLEFSMNFDRKKMPTPTQMRILQYVIEHNGNDVYQKDLEKVLNLRRATVSGVLQTMEKNELIDRITDFEDSRTKKIVLNEKAKNMFLENKNKVKELEKIALKGISKEELIIFKNILEKMKDNIKNNKGGKDV